MLCMITREKLCKEEMRTVLMLQSAHLQIISLALRKFLTNCYHSKLSLTIRLTNRLRVQPNTSKVLKTRIRARQSIS
jgi:hypothetical protein